MSNLEFRPYKCKTKEVVAERITTENKKAVYYALLAYVKDDGTYSYNPVNNELTKNGREVPDGDYIVKDGVTAYTESDGKFRDSYCPMYVSEEDQRVWHCMSTVTRRRYDTAEEAIAHTKELLNSNKE